MLNNSSPGQAVYEPFSGSGTSIIAAETIGRACHAVEIEPAYVDVGIERWQAFSGKQATLEGDDCWFANVAAGLRPPDLCWPNTIRTPECPVEAPREGAREGLQ